VSFEKSVDGFLFLLGDLKVGKSLGLPFDISDIINRKLISNALATLESGLPCREDKALTLSLC
jgi:hypothetical protein